MSFHWVIGKKFRKKEKGGRKRGKGKMEEKRWKKERGRGNKGQ